MEVLTAGRRNGLWYALTIVGAAIPTALWIRRRAKEQAAEACEEARLLDNTRISLQKAAKIALKTVPGRLLEVELEDMEECPVWEIEVLPKCGTDVCKLLIDARSGELLEISTE